jgi:S1-C subfamily serine protease
MKSNIKSLGILGAVLAALTVRQNLVKTSINKNISLVNNKVNTNNQINPQELYETHRGSVVTVVSVFEMEEEEINPLTYFLRFPYNLLPDFFKNKVKKKIVGMGSGFIYYYNNKKYIITNCHVIQTYSETTGEVYTATPYIIEKNSKIQSLTNITNKGGKEADLKKAIIIGYDDFKNGVDIAVLKCDELKETEGLKFNDSTTKVGDPVMAMGNPIHFLLGDTVTTGIVSGVDRYITNNYTKFIQTDTSINRGNSGGPLINSSGEVVGVNTILLSSTGESNGLGFAIPSKRVKDTVEDLIDLKQTKEYKDKKYCYKNGTLMEKEELDICPDKDQAGKPKASRISRYWVGIRPMYVIKELLDKLEMDCSNIPDCLYLEDNPKCTEEYNSWLTGNSVNYNLDCNILDICKGVFVIGINEDSPAGKEQNENKKLIKYDIIVGMTNPNPKKKPELVSVNDVQEFIINLDKLYNNLDGKKIDLRLKVIRKGSLLENDIRIELGIRPKDLGIRPKDLKKSLNTKKNLEFGNRSYLEI